MPNYRLHSQVHQSILHNGRQQFVCATASNHKKGRKPRSQSSLLWPYIYSTRHKDSVNGTRQGLDWSAQLAQHITLECTLKKGKESQQVMMSHVPNLNHHCTNKVWMYKCTQQECSCYSGEWQRTMSTKILPVCTVLDQNSNENLVHSNLLQVLIICGTGTAHSEESYCLSRAE